MSIESKPKLQIAGWTSINAFGVCKINIVSDHQSVSDGHLGLPMRTPDGPKLANTNYDASCRFLQAALGALGDCMVQPAGSDRSASRSLDQQLVTCWRP